LYFLSIKIYDDEIYKKIYKNFQNEKEIYNNNDKIAFLTFEDTHVLLMLGTQFFCSIVYSLCVKYSIEKI
jgi:hypothetical protein